MCNPRSRIARQNAVRLEPLRFAGLCYHETCPTHYPVSGTSLDLFPSPAPDHPGLFIRDPYRYSDAMLVIPPPLVECLRCFDGRQTDLDLRSLLVRITGELQVGDLETHLVETLSSAGFLEDEAFAQMKAGREQEFADAPKREPAHAGGAYPLEIGDPARDHGALHGAAQAPRRPRAYSALPRRTSARKADGNPTARHTRLLGPELRDRTFVILATSHYGEPERFGLTRKPFVTPLGETAHQHRPGGLAGGAWRHGRPDGRLLPFVRAHRRVTGDLPAAYLRTRRSHSADSVRTVRAQYLPGRRARSRPRREALPRVAGRDGGARRRPPVLDSGHRHGAHGRALSRRFRRTLPTAA